MIMHHVPWASTMKHLSKGTGKRPPRIVALSRQKRNPSGVAMSAGAHTVCELQYTSPSATSVAMQRTNNAILSEECSSDGSLFDFNYEGLDTSTQIATQHPPHNFALPLTSSRHSTICRFSLQPYRLPRSTRQLIKLLFGEYAHRLTSLQQLLDRRIRGLLPYPAC